MSGYFPTQRPVSPGWTKKKLRHQSTGRASAARINEWLATNIPWGYFSIRFRFDWEPKVCNSNGGNFFQIVRIVFVSFRGVLFQKLDITRHRPSSSVF